MAADKADHMSDSPYYQFERVPGTNIYVVVQDTSKSTPTRQDTTCKCGSTVSFN